MKKLLTLSMVALVAMTAFVGCSSKTEEAPATETPVTDSAATLKDGTFSVEGTADDKGWVPTAEVVISDGAITAITFDAKDQTGALKSEAVASGTYDMLQAGAQGSWTDEMAAFATAIIDGTVDVNTMTFSDDGKTDAVSGCTITVQPYAELVKSALEQAAM